MAESWWDPRGQFKPLHRLNPVRLRFIRDRVCRHFTRDPESPQPLTGLRLLDIGCGGGLVAEPLARLGAAMVGVDATEPNIAVARLHAGQVGLAIDYRHGSAEELARAGERFDVVLALEVIEHVADLSVFVQAMTALVEPGGLLILSTLNRTAKAFALAIIGAEYVLGWLPRGTHDWRKFRRPSELAGALRQQGFTLAELTGLVYSALSDDWSLGRDLDVNYMAVATGSIPTATSP